MAKQKQTPPLSPIPTARYEAQGPVLTGRYDLEAPVPESSSAQAPRLQKGAQILLKGQAYEVLDLLSRHTLEAHVYRVRDAGGEDVVLKLYHYSSDPNKEPNAEALSRIRDMRDPDILPLYDYGVGADKYLERHCFEISAFAEGGDMFADPAAPGQKMSLQAFKDKYTPQFLEQVVVPELHNGIQKLHAANIYHCDLKPGNIFFKDKTQKDILIGDYGSAKIAPPAGQHIPAMTQYIAGTPFFQSPEHSNRIISSKTDYYSLGAILIQLLYPEHIGLDDAYWELDQQKHSRYFTSRISQQPLPFLLNPRYQRLNDLISGLTLFDLSQRFGGAEVQQWLEGKSPRLTPPVSGNVPPLKLREHVLHSERDFIDYLKTGSDIFEELIEDHTTYELLKQWLQATYNRKRREEFERMASQASPFGEDYLRDALLRFFTPGQPVEINGRHFSLFRAADLDTEVRACIAALDGLWKQSGAESVRFPLFQMELCLHQIAAYRKGTPSALEVNSLIDSLYAAFSAVQNPSAGPVLHSELNRSANQKLLNLFYAFDPGRGFRDADNRPLHELEAIALYFAESPRRFDYELLNAELRYFAHVNGPQNLNMKSLPAFLLQVLKSHAETRVELSDVQIDRSRNYHIRYGYHKSLQRYLRERGLPGDYKDASTKLYSFEYQRRIWETSGVVFHRFLKSLLERHHIANLSPDHMRELRARFRNLVAGCYLRLYHPQALALLFFLPLLFFTWRLATQRLRLDHHWRFSSSPEYIPFEEAQALRFDTVFTDYYLVTRTANLRAGASALEPIVAVVPANTEVLLLDDQSQESWLRIAHQGQQGYMSAKLLAFARREAALVPAQKE